MLTTILPYLIEFGAGTVILTIALLVMIKIQSLDFRFLPLTAAAAISMAVQIVLLFFLEKHLDMLATYIVHPVACTILIIGVSKATGAESVDVLFTVFVGYAVEFCINLFILGALLGDLRPSVSEQMELSDAPESAAPVAASTNRPAEPNSAEQKTNSGKGMIVAAKNFFKKSESTNTSVQGEAPSVTSKADQEKARKAKELAKKFSLKGITRSATKSTAMIHTGVKTYTIVLGEEISIAIAGSEINVRCDELLDESVILTIEGEPVELFLY